MNDNAENMARVLHIEDDPDCRLLVSRKLQGQLELDQASCMADALVMAHRTQYDGILLDAGLPDTDRDTALRRLKAAVCGVAIIILTGHDDEAWTRRQIAENASGVLLKGRDDLEALPFASQIKRAIAVSRACKAIDSACL